MKINYILFFLSYFIFFNNAMATDTLDCNSNTYHISVNVGSNDYFSKIVLFDKRTTPQVQVVYINKEELDKAELIWDSETLNFEGKNVSGIKVFFMCVNTKQSNLIVDNLKEKVICDWNK